MGFFKAIGRGILWLCGAAAAIASFAKDIKELVKELDFNQSVTLLTRWLALVPLGDILVWVVAVGLVSFLIWVIYTRPRQQSDEKYLSELEKRSPGLTKRRRRRKRR